MKKLLGLALVLAGLSGSAFAVDNVAVTAGSGTTMKTKDVGSGVQESQVLLSDAAGLSILGTAGSANANVITIQGVGSMVALQVAESGTWNITNISGTISLPTGAATAANQTTANTSLATIATNSGTAATSANQTTELSSLSTISTNTAGLAQGSTTSGQTGVLVQCAVTTSAPTYTTAKTDPLSCDTTGTLRVTGGGVAQGSTTSGQSGNLIQCAVTTSAPTYTTAQTNPLSCDTTGGLRIAGQTPGPQLKSASASITPASDQGWTPAVYSALTGLSLTDVKASVGVLGVVHCSNPNASATFVQVFNVVHGSVTLGTTVPTWVVMLAPSTSDGMALAYGSGIVLGGSGISVAATTTATGASAPGSAVICSFGYS